MIKVHDLNKYFNRRQRNEIHVLNHISLDFPEKGLVVLLGPSGSGKTTLLNVLGGLDKVQSGSIEFDNEKIDGYDVKTWDKIRNEHVGYIFQNYNLLPQLSVFDNIAFVLKMMGINDPEVIETRVNYILNAVHMYPFRKKKGLQLSGGQQQRVAIARALVKNPSVIIADEPTGNLDSKNTLDIMNIIKQISEEKLVVLVTHEKELATFYGDRIIEIKDGEVVNDYENASSDHSHIGKDDTIYLKDYKHIQDGHLNGVNLSLYSDHEDELKDLNIKLIVKNKTLYLDVTGPYQKKRIVDDSAGVVIKDAHYVKKTKAELIETSFDKTVLDNAQVHRQSKLMVSIKQTMWLAFQKVLKTSRKGKIMLFSFIISGMVMALTVSMFGAVAILQPEQYMNMPEGYVSVSRSGTDPLFDYNDLMALKADDDDHFNLNPFGSGSFMFIQPNGTTYSTSISGSIELASNVTEKDLVYGDMPEDDEVLVTTLQADLLIEGSLFQNANGQDIGIWDYEYLVKEKVRIGDFDVRISGIVDSDLNMIYMTETLALYYRALSENIVPIDYMSETLLKGNSPTFNQVAISERTYHSLFQTDLDDATFPVGLPYQTDIVVSGVYEASTANDYMYVSNDTIIQAVIGDTNQIYIHSDDAASLTLKIEDETDYDATDIYQTAIDSAKEARAETIVPASITAGVLIGVAMIGFYFVIRSSMISRIYEVSVYRALGVKKNDIFVSFLVEIFVLTTVSTMIGYFVATLGLSKLSGGFIGEFNFFTVNFLTVVIGLILSYLVNMLAGMLPIFMLLRKTPAQILAQYDI